MGHRHTREELLAGAVATAYADGLSRLTYGRVAAHLGVSDRMLVYYFPSKDDLVTEVLVSLGLELQERLARTLLEPAADHLDAARRSWPTLASRRADRTFALFFEASGLAAAKQPPYDVVVPQLVDGWVDWVAERLVGGSGRRRAEAQATVALLDGLLLLRQIAGPAVADRAATALGVR